MTTTTRGYGAPHQHTRRDYARDMARGIRYACTRCGHPIDPAEPWDLDHDDDDRTRYRGPAHARCNRSAGGRAARGAHHRRRPERHPGVRDTTTPPPPPVPPRAHRRTHTTTPAPTTQD